MSRRTGNPVGGLIVIVLIATGTLGAIFAMMEHVMEFFLWLFAISMTDFGLSPGIEIFVKISTFVISYALVGLLFSLVGGFKGKSKLMRIAYFITSTLLGFGLGATIMFLESNIVIVSWIILGIVISILLTLALILLLKQIKIKKTQEV